MVPSEQSDFDSLLSKVEIPHKLIINQIVENHTTGEIELKPKHSPGSLPSLEAFQSSDLVKECRRLFELDEQEALSELPGFLARISLADLKFDKSISKTENERRVAQHEYDNKVSTFTLAALVGILGEPAIQLLISSLASERVATRVKVIDAFRVGKIYNEPLMRGVIRRLGASLVESKEEKEVRYWSREQLQSEAELIHNDEPQFEQTVKNGNTIDDTDLNLCDEQEFIYSYLSASTEYLGDHFEVLLDDIRALDFQIGSIDSRVLRHQEVLIKSYQQNPQRNLPHLVNGLRSEEPKIRMISLKVVGELKLDEDLRNIITYIGDLLHDPVDYINFQTLRTLEALGSGAASYGSEVLAIARSKEDPRSTLAISVLGSLGEPQAEIVLFLTEKWGELSEIYNDSPMPDKDCDLRRKIRPVLESLGSFIHCNKEAIKIFDEAVDMNSRIVREGLVSGLMRNLKFIAVEPYLKKLMRTQSESTKLVRLAFRYGAHGEALVKEYRKELVEMIKVAVDEEKKRLQKLLTRINEMIENV